MGKIALIVSALFAVVPARADDGQPQWALPYYANCRYEAEVMKVTRHPGFVIKSGFDRAEKKYKYTSCEYKEHYGVAVRITRTSVLPDDPDAGSSKYSQRIECKRPGDPADFNIDEWPVDVPEAERASWRAKRDRIAGEAARTMAALPHPREVVRERKAAGDGKDAVDKARFAAYAKASAACLAMSTAMAGTTPLEWDRLPFAVGGTVALEGKSYNTPYKETLK